MAMALPMPLPPPETTITLAAEQVRPEHGGMRDELGVAEANPRSPADTGSIEGQRFASMIKSGPRSGHDLRRHQLQRSQYLAAIMQTLRNQQHNLILAGHSLLNRLQPT